MRHRSPRPLLDLWRRRPGLPPLRRSLVVAGSVAAFATASGFALAAHESGAPADRPAAGADGPSLTAPSTNDRSPSPSRSSERPGQGATDASPWSPSPSALASRSSKGRPTPDDLASLASALPAPAQVPTGVPRKAPGTPTSAARTTAPSQAPASKAPASTTPSGPAPGDTTAPQTSASTVSSNHRTWVVSLSASEPATFECSLDGAGYGSCSGTADFAVDPGQHTLSVRATDAAGNTDPTPAVLTAQVNAGAGD